MFRIAKLIITVVGASIAFVGTVIVVALRIGLDEMPEEHFYGDHYLA